MGKERYIRNINSGMFLVKCKIGITEVIFVAVYAPVNKETVKQKKDTIKFWFSLNKYFSKLQKEGQVKNIRRHECKGGRGKSRNDCERVGCRKHLSHFLLKP